MLTVTKLYFCSSNTYIELYSFTRDKEVFRPFIDNKYSDYIIILSNPYHQFNCLSMLIDRVEAKKLYQALKENSHEKVDLAS